MTTSQEETMTADYRAEAVKLLAASSRHTDTGDATDQHIALALAGQGTIRALLAVHDEVRGLRADLAAERDAAAEVDEQRARAETAEDNERTLRDSWMTACETVRQADAEVERLTEERNEALSALADTEYDADGNALVTVRVDDLKVGLPTWATGRAATAVRRLRRALDERGES